MTKYKWDRGQWREKTSTRQTTSMTKFTSDKNFKIEMWERANDNMKLMNGTEEPIKRIIDDHEIIFALWPKGESGFVPGYYQPDDFDVAIIKGLKQFLRAKEGVELKCSAIFLHDYKHADYVHETFGDGKKIKDPKLNFPVKVLFIDGTAGLETT